jgi:hypothetical protein
MLLGAFPEMDAAAHANLRQADQILVKPIDVTALVAAINERLVIGPPAVRIIETVATILERTTASTIQGWFALVQTDKKLTQPGNASYIEESVNDALPA